MQLRVETKRGTTRTVANVTRYKVDVTRPHVAVMDVGQCGPQERTKKETTLPSPVVCLCGALRT